MALDFALQCSPDHPWVKQHPNWFRTKPDGTIAFAENPPKKYQDIYPIDFNADMEGIEAEVERIMDLWVKAGVTIFRVDNPHTKPVRFWQDVIAAVTKKHPEVLFLAEAFTRPGMMRALSYAGFTQSHCYFPWRNTKEELEEYLEETNGDGGFYQHNTFWPSTPDIMTAYLRDNGIAGHAVRAVLAAMGSPSWASTTAMSSSRTSSVRDSKSRSTTRSTKSRCAIGTRPTSTASPSCSPRSTKSVPSIRHAAATTTCTSCRATMRRGGVPAPDPGRAYRYRQAGYGDRGGEPRRPQHAPVHRAHRTARLRFATDKPLKVRDELTGREFEWSWDNYVSLAPWADVAHVLTVVED
mgnify:CR=1 FL=1